MLTTVENLVEEDRYDQVLNVIEAYLEDDPVEAHAPIAREQRAFSPSAGTATCEELTMAS